VQSAWADVVAIIVVVDDAAAERVGAAARGQRPAHAHAAGGGSAHNAAEMVMVRIEHVARVGEHRVAAAGAV